MRPHGVVVDPPRLNDLLRFGDAEKPVLVQAFVAKLAVETLDVGVFNRLAWSNEAQRDSVPVGPRVERPSGEFGSVVPSLEEVMTGQLLL
jgi:hypothetical protein